MASLVLTRHRCQGRDSNGVDWIAKEEAKEQNGKAAYSRCPRLWVSEPELQAIPLDFIPSALPVTYTPSLDGPEANSMS